MVRMCHATCRSALEKAVQDGLIRVNPALGCKLPPKKAREMQVLTREELQRFLIQAKFEGYYEVFLLDLATGLRRGELMALQWDDLNFKTGVLNVNKQVYSPKWPDGKKHARNVYAHTREECEEKLKVLIVEMKAEIEETQRLKNLGEGDGSPLNPPKKLKKAKKTEKKSKSTKKWK